MSYVSPYSKKKCVSYLACKTFVEKTPSERLKLLKDKGLCYQCLTPGAKVDHAKTCNDHYCCKDPGHSRHEKNIMYLFATAIKIKQKILNY